MYRLNARKSSSDRFIPRRANANFDLSYYYIKKSGESTTANNPLTFSEPDCFVNTAKYFYNLHSYRKQLWKAMMPSKKRVLEFSSPKKEDKCSKYENPSESLWPVYARNKPLIGPPLIILDMPDLDTNICHQIVDWGKKGYIATIYENEVHLWHPTQKLEIRVTRTSGTVQHCVKWNNEGTHFATALNNAKVAIWDCEACKTTRAFYCQCIFRACVVTTMEWTKNNCLVTGCTQGRLCAWSPDFMCTKTYFMAHVGEIINIKSSCYGNYLITTGVDCSVKIWKWPEFIEHIEINLHRPIKGVAWHPWRDSLLAIGGLKVTSLWNVNNQKPLDCKRHPHPNSSVDNLSFNPLSGELLVSYYSYDNIGNGLFILTVLKGLDKIVDEVQFHNGRVPYLMWDSAGTKLATASADENLCIWDFFGTSTKTEKKFLRWSNKKNLSSDMFKNLNMFNSCIR